MDFSHFQFASPWWLWALLLVPFCLLLRRNSGSMSSISFPSLHFFGKIGTKPGSRFGKIGPILATIGLTGLILALARPQTIDERSYVKASGIDILLALDISGSMDTRDMVINDRNVTRLTTAKAVIANFIKQRKDDRIGLITFAGKTKPASPLTLDHDLLLHQLSQLSPFVIHADGTAIGSAIAAASSRLQSRKDTKSKIIILVTDGASNSGQLSPTQAAKLAAKLDIKIYTIAVGTENGRLNRSLSKQEFDEPTLKEIAAITKAEHYRAKDTNSLINIFSTINNLEKTEVSRQTTQTTKELFPYFLAFGGFFICLAGFVFTFKRKPAP